MTNDELRKSICDSLKQADRRTLKIIKALLREYYTPDAGEGDKGESELMQELNRRVDAYKTGQSKHLTFEEVKARYQKRKKKRIILLSKENEAELQKRLREYKSGKGKSYTVEEARSELRHRIAKK